MDVLVVSAHPDDESIGAPATLLQLADAGHHIVNLACSLGRPEQEARRRAEVGEACRRAGFESLIASPPARISGGDDLASAEGYVRDVVAGLCRSLRPAVVVSPSPHDGHPGHEVVGRATAAAVIGVGSSGGGGPVWWIYGIWADLPFPSLYVPFDQSVLDRALHVLEAHAGELARNDFRRAVVARATLGAVVGQERVFGFGSRPCSDLPYADVLTEVGWDGVTWRAGRPRVLEPSQPLSGDRGRSLSWWIDGPGLGRRLR